MSEFTREMQAIKAAYDAGDTERKVEALAKVFRAKPVILYGAGTLSSFVKDHLAHHDVPVECFCDTYKTGTHGGTGLPIISAQQLNRDYPDAIVIVTSELHGKSILKTLAAISYPGTVYSFDDLLGFYTISYDEFRPHVEGYEWAYQHYSDAVSKRIVLDSAHTRLMGTAMTPSAYPQYFEPDILPVSGDEIFVDGGCFIGDTAEEYIRQTGGKYAHIYGFEPDENNLKKAKANLAGLADITLVHGGLWYMTNQYKFLSGEFGGSKISDEGDAMIQTYALDEYFKGKTPPTFIKMDVEGSEAPALKGASAIIKSMKPKLAVCVYHSVGDMYHLPQQILSLNPGYKLTLRHYSRWYAESVCYAV